MRALNLLYATLGLLALVATSACGEQPQPKPVDTTALYRERNGQEMKFEASASGLVRATIGATPGYVLIRNGEAYVIQADAKGPVAIKASDMATAMRFGGVQFPTIEADYVEKGEETVGDRTGRAIYVTIGKDQLSPIPMFVMSDDPELSGVGKGVAEYYKASISLTGANPHTGFKKSLAVLESGTPIKMFGYFDLISVNHDSIPAERFALPRVASQDEVLKMIPRQPTVQ